MKIFRDFTLTWWQAGLFKWGMFLLGIGAGAYWPALFSPYLPILLVMAVTFLSYFTVIWVKLVSN